MSDKNKGGRPRIELTDEEVEQVEKLAPVLTQAQIADFLGISDRTLRNRITDDERVSSAYARGRARAFAGVAGNLVKQAQSGNVQAIIFYLKSQAGWKETTVQEHTGKDGLPIQTEHTDKVQFYIPGNDRSRNTETTVH